MKGKEVVEWIKRYNMEEQDLRVEIPQEGPCGLYECFHCLHRSVLWQSDFSFEDYGYEGEGIVQNLICTNCGAEIEYMISFSEEGEDRDGVEVEKGVAEDRNSDPAKKTKKG